MSAEMLRKAAVKMRELAEGNDAQTPVNLPVEAVWLNSRQYLVMTPDFALAVADWLDHAAQHAEVRIANGWPYNDSPCDPRALAVARAYLDTPDA